MTNSNSNSKASGLKARFGAVRPRTKVIAGIAALCVAGGVVAGAGLLAAKTQTSPSRAVDAAPFQTREPVQGTPAAGNASVPATSGPESPAPAPSITTLAAQEPAVPGRIEPDPVPGDAGPATADTRAQTPEQVRAAPTPVPVPVGGPVQAAPAPAPAPAPPAPAPVVVPAPAPVPAPVPAPYVPPRRTEGLNQSLGSINAHRAANGKPAFVAPGPACRLVATAVGTALDSYQHQGVVLSVWGKATGATFVKGPDYDTLTVYQCG